MKNSSIFKIFVLALSSIMLFSACGAKKAPEKAPEDVLKEGINNLTNVKSSDYELTVKGDASADEAAAAEAGFSSFTADGTFNGSYNLNDVQNAVFSLAVDLGMTQDGGKDEAVKGEIRFVKDTMYFLLSELTDFNGQIPAEMVASFMSQWWFVILPPESVTEMFSIYKEETEMTPEEKQLKELFDNTKMFTNVKYVGNENAGGVNSFRYTAELDREAVVNYLVESAKITGDPATDEEVADLTEALNTITLDGDIWVGQEDTTFRKFVGKLVVENLDGISMDFDISYEMSNLNKSVTVDVPEGAAEFNPLAALGGGV